MPDILKNMEIIGSAYNYRGRNINIFPFYPIDSVLPTHRTGRTFKAVLAL